MQFKSSGLEIGQDSQGQDSQKSSSQESQKSKVKIDEKVKRSRKSPFDSSKFQKR